jgi:2-amino-4-hydroxy-6-hydroxymethyldihydropteridine diphosphokinase
MSTPARQAFVAIGANLGARAMTVAAAVQRLRTHPQIEVLAESPVYETEPVGVTDQPRFLNQVVGVATALTPEALLETLQQIERDFGRERLVRWGPRSLDLDLIAFEGETRDTATLTLPHPRLFEREFVTVPLRDVLAAPAFREHPAWRQLRDDLGPAQPSASAIWLYTGQQPL